MVSLTQQTERRRKMRHRRMGRPGSKLRMRACSPKFPVHPEGYDPAAPDAKQPSKSEPTENK
jgi:hypothetical protein